MLSIAPGCIVASANLNPLEPNRVVANYQKLNMKPKMERKERRKENV